MIASRDSDDREVRFLTKLPGPVLRAVIAAGEWLDRWNLLPASMIGPDPMYTSMFLANLGSLNIDSAYHHLYEYGTCGVFGAVGTVKKITRMDRAERQHTCDVLKLTGPSTSGSMTPFITITPWPWCGR